MKITKQILLLLTVAFSSQATELHHPPFSLMDKNHVNMTSKQVSPSVTDVSIGGKYGLTHTVTPTVSTFGYDGESFGLINIGAPDQYKFARIITWNEYLHKEGSTSSGWVKKITVVTDKETVEFYYDPPYNAIRDPRYKLEKTSEYWKLTRPDGTQLIYDDYPLTKIIYPNGFTIDLNRQEDRIYSIQTNTGFQLKYAYNNATSTTLDVADNPEIQNPKVDPYWDNYNPQYIYALNNAEEYCAHSSASCSFSQTWPRAEHIWPNGMPRAMALADSVFKIKDAAGRITEFHHKPYERYDAKDANGNYQFAWPIYARIHKIKFADDKAPSIEYDYANIVEFEPSAYGIGKYFSQDASLKSATVGSKTWGYGYSSANYKGTPEHSIVGGRPSMGSRMSDYHGAPIWHFVPEYDIYYGWSYSGRIQYMTKKVGKGTIHFTYDGRGNVETIKENNVITQTAVYLASCTDSTRKTCNKATTVTDANGNTTYYEYNDPSGQVTKITHPQDKHGISPQTRYQYQDYYAKVKNSSGALQTASTPLRLLHKESFCINSAYVNNSCSGNDEVVTTYKYEHNNLFLTSVSVWSQQENQTRTTCYEYDKLGNQIGETTAKGSCN
ncbi:RHS repeat domain-containing protein [Catenovulum sediminis]|uniref:RHS repeat domain-containing protein n=1 Tax=Catenovulum sediminis TaxID=1740262 RepID=UPI001180C1ED|nr:RHS repeat domain-containing protein [Catenovulum sediminis]